MLSPNFKLKRTAAASPSFLATAQLSCRVVLCHSYSYLVGEWMHSTVNKSDTVFRLILVLAGWCCIQYESVVWWWWRWWRHCWWITTSGFLCSDSCLCYKASKVFQCLLFQRIYWFDVKMGCWPVTYFSLSNSHRITVSLYESVQAFCIVWKWFVIPWFTVFTATVEILQLWQFLYKTLFKECSEISCNVKWNVYLAMEIPDCVSFISGQNSDDRVRSCEPNVFLA